MAMKQAPPEIISPKSVMVGDKKAPITLMMYGDYESEACSKANEVVKKLLDEYEGKMRFNFRHFPLTQIHQRAQKAAEAAVAAAQEGKFWEMHNILFENRKQLGTTTLKIYAKEAGSTNKKFLETLVNSTYSWEVRADLLEGLEKGVRDVPVFFINGERFTDKPTFDNLRKAVEGEWKKIKKDQKVKQRA